MNRTLISQGNAPRRQAGVSIIMAIFLLLLFAAISAFMVSLISTSHVTAAQDVEGSRTYQAARAGVEWGMYQLDADGLNAALPGCFATTTLNQIPNYSVSVACTPFPGAASSYQENGRQVRVYQIVATAVPVVFRAPGVERQISVTVEKCRDPAVTAAPFDC
ncbi:MAG: hypothetical protein H6943_04465 [Zoogloeaceae bacterium]|nr:hypothetical protein [Zoogloeaceae bacterium]